MIDGPAWMNFGIGVAAGLSVGILTSVWNSRLQWFDQKLRPDPVQMNLNQR